MMQAFTTLGNEGTMVKPYLISKIVDADGNVVLENKRTEVKKVFSKSTTDKMRKLMRGVVDGTSRISTGTMYQINGYDLIGKTGTAEISSSRGGYLTGSTNYVKSFVGLFPGDDPEIIIYIAASKMQYSNQMTPAVTNLVKNIATYLNIYEQKTTKDSKTYEVANYVNKNTETVTKKLDSKKISYSLIGDGNKIIKQYPSVGTVINKNNRILLLTNSNEYKMIDISGWSRSDVVSLCNLMNIDVTFEGNGYVKSFNIKKGTVIKKNDVLEVKLQKKF